MSVERAIVAWATAGSDQLERSLPLLWTGRRLRQLGSKAEIALVFIDGFERLSEDYRSALKEAGYRLLDASVLSAEIAGRFPELRRFGVYGLYCFLRWPILQALMPGQRIMHFDGDIVFNQPVEALEEDLSPFTFVLQGCPALAVVDAPWLDAYGGELERFAADIDGYCDAANREAEGAELSAITKWAGQRHSPLMEHDQDLISHLIHTDRLPQAEPAAITRASRAVLFENPLYPHVYFQDRLPLRYERRGLVDYFSDAPVAFWHMQSNFCVYLAMADARPGFLRKTRLPNPLARRGADYYAMRAKARLGTLDTSRQHLYRAFFERDDFSGVFNSRVFWASGAFG